VPRLTVIACLALALGSGAAVDAQTQLDMNRDAGRVLRDAESKLAAAVTTYRERLDRSQRAAFDDSQQRWVSYRKAACTFQASGVAGGSAHEMVFATCLTAYANQRLQIISELMNCIEGDLSCPVFKRGS
jgi:uncharacterized protein YecT (DUF1311 family)